MSALIEFDNVCKYYQMGDTLVKAADHISMQINKGEFVAIVGQSGSGKSTCMNIIGCLDVPTAGTYKLNGRDVGRMSRDELAEIRNELLGFIFQQYNLLPKLSLIENVGVPLVYAGVPRGERRRRAAAALERVGLGDKLRNKPNQLSGGQQQRVSIARALAGRPAVILADEPTGALDSHTGREVLGMLQELHRATPWCLSPTTTPLPCRPSASSGWRTAMWCTTAMPTHPKPWCSPIMHPRQNRRGVRHDL